MERFSISMNSEDIDLFERRRYELGLSKSAFIRYLISEHENGIPDFIAFRDTIKQMAVLSNCMKEILLRDNFETEDKLILYEKISSLNTTLKDALDNCANLAQLSKTDREKNE